MVELDYAKQAQRYYQQAPTIILGSGASAAFGLSGMVDLASYLLCSINLDSSDEITQQKWQQFVEVLNSGKDLETALHEVRLSTNLTEKIVRLTWELLNPQDINVFNQSIKQPGYFPLSELISSLFRSALDEINIITTNYDRLAEYAVEQAGHHHYTGFSHGFCRAQKGIEHIRCNRIVKILKVHGSLDWFVSPISDIVGYSHLNSIPDNHIPKIVTPGIEKYSATYHEPFRTIINLADDAIRNATSYLCIGFGFNDEHIQEKLVEKCVRENACITLITHGLTNSARDFLLSGKVKNFLAIECGKEHSGSVIYSSEATSPVFVDDDYWSLKGYLKLVC
ncbi:SIR2 family protein [Dickeya dadantii]|uniref:SIR2 family protein n=1 Tax=Dickeya dadantii TaxID=204038 RepID=UPI0035A851CB